MIPFDLRRDLSRGGHKKKSEGTLEQMFSSTSAVQCRETITCAVSLWFYNLLLCQFSNVILDVLKCIGALQDDVYILVHPGLRVGGWECSVGQAAEWG